jgi:hypothetical protein
MRDNSLRSLRSFIAGILGVSAESARNGDWWEVDLIIVTILGVFLLGIMAWSSL